MIFCWVARPDPVPLTAATITTSGTASTTGAINVAAAKAITIDAVSNLTAASIATTGTTAALTVKGGATRVNVGTLDTDIVTVDATGLTGGLTAALNVNVTSFKGGAGADVVTTAAVTGAAGSIDGGAGSADRLVVAATADVDTAGERARYVNFEELATAGQNLDVSTFTGITKLVASGVVTLDKVSAALAGNILVNGGATLTANVVDATTVGQLDKLSLTVSDEVTTTSTITLANIVAAGVETININAVDATTVTALLGATAMANLNVTGAADVSITTDALALNVNTKIDASAATGAVTVNATAATTNGLEIVGSTGSKVNTLTGSALNDKLTGGAGNDVLSGLAGNDIIIGGAGNDSITGGAGADALTGGAGNDTFVIATRADTQSAAFLAADTTAANIDRIVDFAGNGASAGDTIQLGVAANVFGTALQFTNATTAAVTAVTVATAADFTALAAAVQAASAGVASSAAVAQVYDVTVTAGNLAGRYVIVNDDALAVAATDTIISITGVSGALNVQDFTFA
jgi:Ca2+-binding RTX toxin-like protein